MKNKKDQNNDGFFEFIIICKKCKSNNCFWYVDNGYCLIVECKNCENECDFGQ
jgi:hypothetical protein